VGIYSSSIKNLFKSTSVGKITLYFNDDSFARIGKPNQEKIHRTHKVITKDYANLLSEFCAMFGEDGEEPPDSLCRPEMVPARDEWHRRKILRLQGNTYMNIFALYGKFKKSTPGFNKLA
jgi:hypothetical protein